MKIYKHKIINIHVSQGKFDAINKWCHAEVNQTYPTCALLNLSVGLQFF